MFAYSCESTVYEEAFRVYEEQWTYCCGVAEAKYFSAFKVSVT